jgi:hypothetical protein
MSDMLDPLRRRAPRVASSGRLGRGKAPATGLSDRMPAVPYLDIGAATPVNIAAKASPMTQDSRIRLAGYLTTRQTRSRVLESRRGTSNSKDGL